MTINEAAAQLHVTRERIQQLISAGQLPAVRNGRRWEVSQADLDTLDYHRGRHVNKRPCGPLTAISEDTSEFNAAPGVLVAEMVRIARQLFGKRVAYQYDSATNRYLLPCSEPLTANTWGLIKAAAYRFLLEMQILSQQTKQ